MNRNPMLQFSVNNLYTYYSISPECHRFQLSFFGVKTPISIRTVLSTQLAMYEWNDDKLYPKFQALKKKNPKLKTLLAVGGWNHENANSPFSAMVKTADTRYNLVNSFSL